MPLPHRPEGGDGETESDSELESKDALATRGGWTIEEGGMPVTDNRARFNQHGSRSSDPDEQNRDDHH